MMQVMLGAFESRRDFSCWKKKKKKKKRKEKKKKKKRKEKKRDKVIEE